MITQEHRTTLKTHISLVIDMMCACRVTNPDGSKSHLRLKEKDWMAEELTKFCIAASEKYIKGQLEHGGNFLLDVNHTAEKQNEQIDFFWYDAGERWQKENLSIANQAAISGKEVRHTPTPEELLLKRLDELPASRKGKKMENSGSIDL